MPINQASGISCHIFTSRQADRPGLPFQEYKHTSLAAAINGPVQEIVFIESTAGTTFEIDICIPPGYYARLHPQPVKPFQRQPDYDVTIKLTLDGVHVKSISHGRTDPPTCRLDHKKSADRRTKRRFQFGQLSLVDADDDALDYEAREKLDGQLCNDEQVIMHLGSIQVDLFRCKLGQRRWRSHGLSGGSQLTSNQMKFSESCKKAALSNTAGLSEEIFPNTNPLGKTFSHASPAWEDPNPFLKFVFKYRSRALLEAEGIVPPQTAAPLLPPAAAPAALPSETSPQSDASTGTPKIKQDPGQSETKSNLNFVGIHDGGEEPNVKAEPHFQHSASANASSSGLGNPVEDQTVRIEETCTDIISPTIEPPSKKVIQDDIPVESQTRREAKPPPQLNDQTRFTGAGSSGLGDQQPQETARTKKRARSPASSNPPTQTVGTIFLTDDANDDDLQLVKNKKFKAIDLTDD